MHCFWDWAPRPPTHWTLQGMAGNRAPSGAAFHTGAQRPHRTRTWGRVRVVSALGPGLSGCCRQPTGPPPPPARWAGEPRQRCKPNNAAGAGTPVLRCEGARLTALPYRWRTGTRCVRTASPRGTGRPCARRTETRPTATASSPCPRRPFPGARDPARRGRARHSPLRRTRRCRCPPVPPVPPLPVSAGVRRCRCRRSEGRGPAPGAWRAPPRGPFIPTPPRAVKVGQDRGTVQPPPIGRRRGSPGRPLAAPGGRGPAPAPASPEAKFQQTWLATASPGGAARPGGGTAGGRRGGLRGARAWGGPEVKGREVPGALGPGALEHGA